MKEYRYSGPASGVTLSDGTEILLWPGKNVSLPEEPDAGTRRNQTRQHARASVAEAQERW